MIIAFVTAVVGFVAGVLVGRANPKKVNAIIADVKAAEKTVVAKA